MPVQLHELHKKCIPKSIKKLHMASSWLSHDIQQQSDIQIRLSGAEHAIFGYRQLDTQFTCIQPYGCKALKLRKHAHCMCRQLGASTAVSHSQNTTDVLENCDKACLDTLQTAEVSEIYEQHEVPNCGTFTAYTDGSIQVTFHDRALLYVKKSREHCEVITPDGHRVTVNAATPLGVEQYVAQAMEFADWAFSSPCERAAVLQQAAKVQKEVGKCQRAAALCDWAQGQLVSAPQSFEEVSNGCKGAAVSEWDAASLLRLPMQEYITQAEREQMIQALLAKSSHLVNTLSD